MSRRDLLDAAALLAAAILTAILLFVFAARACPAPTDDAPCPSAALNRIVVVGLSAVTAAFVVAPFAFTGEFAARRRIVYRGAWARAGRRALLAGLVVAALAALRLGGALSAPLALFVLLAPVIFDFYLTRRELNP